MMVVQRPISSGEMVGEEGGVQPFELFNSQHLLVYVLGQIPGACRCRKLVLSSCTRYAPDVLASANGCKARQSFFFWSVPRPFTS
jgi:hypothetical protein